MYFVFHNAPLSPKLTPHMQYELAITLVAAKYVYYALYLIPILF